MEASDVDIELLQRMADEADRLTLPAWRSGDFGVEIKDDDSPVTEIDRAVETALLSMVNRARPGDGFIGEEVGAHPGTSGRTWIVDGIDGTRNFVDRSARWSTLIALTTAGVAQAGAVTSPGLQRRWSTTVDGRARAEVGTGGSRSSPSEIGVSSTAELAGARVAIWPGDDWARELMGRRHRKLLDLVGEPAPASAMVGEPIPHGAVPVADGRIDAMVAFSGQAWDHAGPSGLVTAAGGRFSAIDGSPAFDTGAGVYSNGRIHDELIALLASG